MVEYTQQALRQAANAATVHFARLPVLEALAKVGEIIDSPFDHDGNCILS